MYVVGLLSSKSEAKELKEIAKICQINDRIHFVVRMQKIKEMISKEDNIF